MTRPVVPQTTAFRGGRGSLFRRLFLIRSRPVPPHGTRWSRSVRILGLACTVAALVGVATVLPLERLPEIADRHGVAGMFAVVPLGALLLSGLVPRSAVSLACGALFGTLVGALCSLSAALLAAGFTFGVGRLLGRETVAGWSRRWDRLGQLDTLTTRRGLLAVIVVRLMPIAPFGVIGYVYGASSIRTRHYLIGTLVAGLPATFSYTALGAAAIAPRTFNPLVLIPTASGFAVMAAVAIHFRRTRREEMATPRR